MTKIIAIHAASLAYGDPIALAVQASGTDPLPEKIVWMPVGRHPIAAHTVNGPGYTGTIVCDEQAFRAIEASFKAITATGRRVFLDCNHDDGAAAAWVKDFSWDPTQGIIAHVAWTARGEAELRGKSYYSFSPAFNAEADTGRVVSLIEGHAAGGLVNSPAFGAMPALIAARLAGGSTDNTASGGKPEDQQANIMNKEQMIKLLAALKIQVPADASEEQIVALFTKHSTELAAQSAANAAEVLQIQSALKKAEDEKAAQAKAAAEAKAASDKAAAELAEVKASLAAMRSAIVGGNSGAVQVSAASLEETVTGYARMNIKNEGAAERGKFYRDHIAPILAKMGGREFSLGLASVLPRVNKDVEAIRANTLGTLVGNLVAQQALALLKYEYPLLSLISTDYSNASVKLNQVVYTRLKSALSASHYTSSFTAAAATTTDVSVTIDTHAYCQVAFNANELAETNRDLFGEQAEVIMQALADDIISYLYALLVVANFTTTPLILGSTGGGSATGTGSGFNRSAMIASKIALKVLKQPTRGSFALLNGAAFGGLSQDPAVVSLAAFQRPEIITGYELPLIAGVQPLEAINLPTTNSMVAFVGNPRAIAVATRVPNDYTTALAGSSYGNVATVTEPALGITIMVTQYVNHDTGTSNYRVSVMYGVAKGDPLAGIITQHS